MAQKILINAEIGNVVGGGAETPVYELITTTTKEEVIELSKQYENDFSNLRIILDEVEYIIDYVFPTGSFSCPFETSDIEAISAEYSKIVSSMPLLSFNRYGSGKTGKNIKLVELVDDPQPTTENTSDSLDENYKLVQEYFK